MNTSVFVVLFFILFAHGIGVQAVCSLGVHDRNIVPDYRMQASSFSQWHGVDHGPRFGRLDLTPATAGNVVAIWAPNGSKLGQWMQVDLGRPTKVAGVVTQGRPALDAQWVTSYTVGCMMDDDMLVIAGSDGKAKVFPGNSDRNTKVTNLFDSPITCRYVRFYPQTYYGYMSMRVDVLGADC